MRVGRYSRGMDSVLVAEGTAALSQVPLEGWIIWAVAIIVAFLVLRLVLRVVKRVVGIVLVLAAIAVLGGGGLGVLTGIL